MEGAINGNREKYLSSPPKHYSLCAISAKACWEITQGDSSVRVGIIDAGIFPHQKLRKNLQDGWDFIDNKKALPKDSTGHGTYIAGIIGAAPLEEGVAGICPNVSLVPLNVVDCSKNFNPTAVVDAVNYATQQNIPILLYCNSSTVCDLKLKSAIEKYPGLFVCSAGNLGINIDSEKIYPPSFNLQNILSVGAVDRDDMLWEWSNYGKQTVHINAPGVEIYTTAKNNFSSYSYNFVSGTSVAAPYVAGVAALIKGALPQADAKFIKSALVQGGDFISGLSDKTMSGRRLNAYQAISIAMR